MEFSGIARYISKQNVFHAEHMQWPVALTKPLRKTETYLCGLITVHTAVLLPGPQLMWQRNLLCTRHMDQLESTDL